MLQMRAPSRGKVLIGRLLNAAAALPAYTGARVRSLQAPFLDARRSRRRAAFARHVRPGEGVSLFLAPEAGLQPFYASHLILARTLQDAGGKPLILSCNGLLPCCSVKGASRIDVTAPGDTANEACRRCLVNARERLNQYEVPDFSVESLLDEERRQKVDNLMAEHDASPWRVSHDGVAVGMICMADVLRDRRRLSTDELSSDDLRYLRGLVRSALMIYLAVEVLAQRHEISRIVYFGDYSYWLPLHPYAAARNIALVNLSHGYSRDIDRRYIRIRPGYDDILRLSQMDEWPLYRDRTLPHQMVEEIVDGALYRLRGHGGASTYSPNWQSHDAIIEQLGFRRDRKTLVAYPSSSDEVICRSVHVDALGLTLADQLQPFADQVTWLRELVAWVAARPEWQLVIRMHPRMGAGHRHAKAATEYGRLQEVLGDLPDNIVIIAPEDRISSYNLAEIADVVLTAWTSMGQEMARFGVPVVAAFRRIASFPTGDFIDFSETAEGYFRTVECCFAQPARWERIAAAFRWTYFINFSTLVDVSDIVPVFNYEQVPPYRTPRHAGLMLDVLNGADIVKHNMDELPRGAAASNAEHAALRAAVEKIVCHFMAAPETGGGAPLRVFQGADHPPAGDAPSLHLSGDATVTFTAGSFVSRRYSPLVHRLGALLAAG